MTFLECQAERDQREQAALRRPGGEREIPIFPLRGILPGRMQFSGRPIMTTYSAIRASDSDRESGLGPQSPDAGRFVASPLDGFSVGGLTLEEFEERTTPALSARTWGALSE